MNWNINKLIVSSMLVVGLSLLTVVQPVSAITVLGKACPYFAGQTFGSIPKADEYFFDIDITDPETIPPYIEVCDGGNLNISADGWWSHTPTPNSGPDGYDNYIPTYQEYIDLGISPVIEAPFNTLLGVFLTDAAPVVGSAPTPLNYGEDMTSPLLQQTFVIGSELENVNIPAGATRLFFGLSDSYEWINNSGSVEVTVCPPVADPDGPYLGEKGTDILFDGTGSFNPDGDPLTYAWDFGDGDTGTGAMPTKSYAEAGIYDVCLTVTDCVLSDTACTIAIVYDPSDGFVTGGGWIYSPAGSLLDSSAEGKATFGFVAKYKRGATNPQGNTEFHFQAGDFGFKSSSYDWLVIAGSKAMFKGEGYIDGMGGGFKFMLTAVDNTEDKFRIKIWNPLSDDVIYDNKRGESDEAEPTTIGGGSIVIHKK